MAVGAEGQAPLGHVGTGDVQLNGIHSVHIQHFRQGSVVFRTVPVDVHDHRGLCHLAELGQGFLQEKFHSGVFQPHAVQHPCRGLHHPLALIAGPGLQGGPLHCNGADVVQVEEIGEFQAEPEGAGGRGHRRLHGHPRQVHLHPGIFIRLHHSTTSWLQNTGPSLQIFIRLPPLPSQEQERQAPRPQPMYFSRDTWQGTPY